MTFDDIVEVGEATFGEALAAVNGELYFLNPSVDLLKALVWDASGHDGALPEIRVLAAGSTLRSFRDEFHAAATTADLVGDGRLSLRVGGDTTETPVLAGADALYVPLVVGESYDVVAADRGEFTVDAFDACRSRWSDGESFDLRTPPLSTIRATYEAEFGTDARADFDDALATVESGRDPAEFDAVLVAILVAARHELLHYDVSKWGEDIGLASKATFSRKKGLLEDVGVLTTEKEPVDMGRPRQRLVLTDEYRDRADDEGLTGIVSNVVY
jgi:hypothetical protein